jgi:hypothetical protein
MKLAMAIHFGNSLEMYIPQSTFEQAIEVLAKEERTMHLALNLDGDNPLAKVSRKIERYLTTSGKKTFKELWTEFFSDVKRQDLEQILEDLQTIGKVTTVKEEDFHTKEMLMYYKAVKI